jgi:hypothetical protein
MMRSKRYGCYNFYTLTILQAANKHLAEEQKSGKKVQKSGKKSKSQIKKMNGAKKSRKKGGRR